MRILSTLTLAAAALAVSGAAFAATPDGPAGVKNIVIVHGAFTDGSGWRAVHDILIHKGYNVRIVQQPMTTLEEDVAATNNAVIAQTGPVVLVGHGYGGSVITEAGARPKVKALVYVAAFLPDTGESAGELSNKVPGSTLAPALHQVAVPGGGGTDLYIDQEKFPQQFAADVPQRTAKLLAVSQRPIDAAALAEPETGTPAWKTIPSYALVPTADKNIPAAAQYWMAQRAHAEVVTVKGASHLVLASQPAKTTALIERAAHEQS